MEEVHLLPHCALSQHYEKLWSTPSQQQLNVVRWYVISPNLNFVSMYVFTLRTATIANVINTRNFDSTKLNLRQTKIAECWYCFIWSWFGSLHSVSLTTCEATSQLPPQMNPIGTTLTHRKRILRLSVRYCTLSQNYFWVAHGWWCMLVLLERDLRLNPVRFKSWWPIWLLDSWNLKTDL